MSGPFLSEIERGGRSLGGSSAPSSVHTPRLNAALLGVTSQVRANPYVEKSAFSPEMLAGALKFHLSAAFGVIDPVALSLVVERLEFAGILTADEDHADWWEVSLP